MSSEAVPIAAQPRPRRARPGWLALTSAASVDVRLLIAAGLVVTVVAGFAGGAAAGAIVGALVALTGESPPTPAESAEYSRACQRMAV